MSFQVGTRPPPPTGIEAILEHFRRLRTATLGHETDFGFAFGVEPLRRPARAVGLAFTVRIPRLDVAAVHYALNLVTAGEILVIDTSGERERACIGGVTAHAAVRAGIGGVVVDGPVTDWSEVVAGNLPIWCRGVTSLTGRRLGVEGSVLMPIQVGGAVVEPGDIVFADEDGVFFVAPERASVVASSLATREARELETIRLLDDGQKLADISGMRQVVEDKITT